MKSQEKGIMKQRKKIILISGIILAGYLAFGIFSVIVRKNGMQYPYGSFLFFPADKRMDFYNVNQMMSYDDPYFGFNSSYPPLILWIAKLFSFVSDYRHYDPHTIAVSETGIASYWVFELSFTLMIAGLLYYAFRRNSACIKSKIGTLLVILVLIFTAPYIYMLDRGNYLIVALAFFLGFACFYGEKDILAAIFLALAASVKIYPLFFGLLYLIDRKWKELGIFLVTGAGISSLSISLFVGDFWENLKRFGICLLGFGGGYGNEVPNVYYGVGLTSALRFPFVVWNNLTVPESFPVMKIYLISGTVLTLFSLWCMRHETSFYKKLIVLSALMVFLTPNSYVYNLVYIMPAILMYMIADSAKHKWKDLVYGILLGLMMVPKSYQFYIPGSLISIQVMIDAGLLLAIVLFYDFADRDTRVKRKVCSRLS